MKKSLTENITTSKQNKERTPEKIKWHFWLCAKTYPKPWKKGWSMTAIWETLRDEGSFTATYNTFRLYVLKYLNGQKSGYSQKDANDQQPKRLAVNQDKEKKPTAMPSFTFNPIPNLKKLL